MKELKDEAWTIEEEYIFISGKIFANEFMVSQLLERLHIGRLELFYLMLHPHVSKDLCIVMVL